MIWNKMERLAAAPVEKSFVLYSNMMEMTAATRMKWNYNKLNRELRNVLNLSKQILHFAIVFVLLSEAKSIACRLR